MRVYILMLLFATCAAFTIFSLPAFAQNEHAAQKADRNLDPHLVPTESSYDDFLRELGIGGQDAISEEILLEDFKVTLRVLNRNLSNTTDLVFNEKGGKVFEDTFLIAVSACIEEHNDIPGNDAAFVTIRDRSGSVLFNGWMLRLFPSAAVFEHPVYDVLMRGCSANN